MSLSPQSKFYLTLVAGIVVVAVFGVAGVNIPLKNIKDTNAKIFAERKELGLLGDQENYRKDLEDEVKQVAAYEKEVNNLLLDRDHILDFIVELERIAKATNNNHTLTLLDQKNMTGDKISFQIETVASFSNLTKFLEAIENTHYHCDIAAITINNQGSESGEGMFKASFTLQVSLK